MNRMMHIIAARGCVARFLLAVGAMLPAVVVGAVLDLAGVDKTVTDVSEISDGVTNSSETQATLTFNIPSAQTYSAVISGNIKVVKSGSATLTLGSATRTYTGGTVVKAGGILKLAANNPTGIGTGNLTIEDGAAVDFNGCLASGGTEDFPAVYAAGTGINGGGALLNTGTQFSNNGFEHVYLTGDLLIYAKYRMNFSTVHTQGYTVRYTGAGQSAFTTIDNSGGGDVSIESGTYTAWGSNDCLGNTPSAGKVHLKGGILNFYGNWTAANDIDVDSFSRVRQGQSGRTATLNGTVTLNDAVAIDGNQKVKLCGEVIAPSAVKNLQISDGNVDVNFAGCFVSNVYMQVYRGTVTFGDGMTMYAPNGYIRHLMQVSSQVMNLTSTINIAAGSDMTFGYFTSGNSSSSTVMTGIVNQAGGTFRTTGCYNATEPDGIRLGHYGNAVSIWNMTGGKIIVDAPYRLNLAISGTSIFNFSDGEVSTTELNVSGRSNGAGHGVWNMTGGVLNIGANGILKSATGSVAYEINLGGGIVRASSDQGFSSSLDMNLTAASGTNVTFDTGSATVALSGVLSGTGGLAKRGSGTLALSGANTYSGTTRLEAGAVAFSQDYPGGDIEIPASALMSSDSPMLSANSIAFSSGKGVRITGADTLDRKKFAGLKLIGESTTAMASAPSLTLVATDGTTIDNGNGVWKLILAENGKALRFGPSFGLIVIMR